MKKHKVKSNSSKPVGNRTVIGIVCIIAALAICFGIAPLVNNINDGKTAVVRVKRDIHKGSCITEDDIELVKVGSYNLYPGVQKSMEGVLGKYASCELHTGAYILSDDLQNATVSASDMLENLDSAHKAISVSISTYAQGLSGKLVTGDIVSVIVFSKEEGISFTPPELQFVQVITCTTSTGVDSSEKADNSQPVTITLLVNKEQAELLAEYEKKASIHFALEYRGDPDAASEYLNIQNSFFEQKGE